MPSISDSKPALPSHTSAPNVPTLTKSKFTTKQNKQSAFSSVSSCDPSPCTSPTIPGHKRSPSFLSKLKLGDPFGLVSALKDKKEGDEQRCKWEKIRETDCNIERQRYEKRREGAMGKSGTC